MSKTRRVPEPDPRTTHTWVFRVLNETAGMDPVDLANDAEYLAALLAQRAADHARTFRATLDQIESGQAEAILNEPVRVRTPGPLEGRTVESLRPGSLSNEETQVRKARHVLHEAREHLGDDLGGFSAVDLLLDQDVADTVEEARALLAIIR